jgi:exosortase A-associated hydrolase 1
MRRLLTFACRRETLGASLDQAAGSDGILFVTGGTQTRIGSHRMLERLAAGLAAAGHPCFRFDRRGVGDSGGDDPGWEGSRDDMIAAAHAFRAEAPQLRRMFGLGLCDGATALALYGSEAGLAGLILLNPWLIEASTEALPPAYIRRHYGQQLLSPRAWRRALTGRMSYRRALAGLRRVIRPPASGLPDRVAEAVRRSDIPTALILASDDATAVAADLAWRKHRLGGEVLRISTDSHTFARSGDREALLAACLSAIAGLEAAQA